MTCLGLLLASFVSVFSGEAALNTPETQLSLIEQKLGGKLGVAVFDLESGQHLEHRARERFPMCSTFKVLAAAAVLHGVDLKQEQLTRFVTYTKADLLEYAPVTKAHIDEGGMTLGALARRLSSRAITPPAIFCSRRSADRRASLVMLAHLETRRRGWIGSSRS